MYIYILCNMFFFNHMYIRRQASLKEVAQAPGCSSWRLDVRNLQFLARLHPACRPPKISSDRRLRWSLRLLRIEPLRIKHVLVRLGLPSAACGKSWIHPSFCGKSVPQGIQSKTKVKQPPDICILYIYGGNNWIIFGMTCIPCGNQTWLDGKSAN